MDAHFVDVVEYFRSDLRQWLEHMNPGRSTAGFSDQDYYRLANLYGPEQLKQRYNKELQHYIAAMEKNEEIQHGGYAKAMDEDTQTSEGKIFGLPPVEKWTVAAEANLFHLRKVAERKIRKFNSTELKYEVDIARLPCILTPEDSIIALPMILEKIFALCTSEFNPSDRITIALDCATLDRGGIYLTMRKLSDINIEALMQKVALLNSQQKLCIDNSFKIRIFRTEMPAGGTTRKNVHVQYDRKRFARSLVTVAVEDNLCLPAALVLGKFRLTHDVAGKDSSEWKNLYRPSRTKKLERLARDIVQESGITDGRKLNLDDLEKLQRNSFSEYQIKVISMDRGGTIIANVPEKRKSSMQCIPLLLDRDHFDLITSPPGFFRSSYFCESCNKSYYKKSKHRCEGTCRLRYRFTEACAPSNPMKCTDCLRTFNNQECFDLHKKTLKNGKTYCGQIFVCKECDVFVNLQNRQQKNPKHRCGEKYCGTCKDFVDHATHQCYVKKGTIETPPKVPRHIYFDYETYNTPEGHKPNLIIAQYPEGTEFEIRIRNRFPPNESPMEDSDEIAKSFGEWLFQEKHRGFTIIALNFRSYDGHFVLKQMLDNHMKGIRVIKRRNQLLDLQYDSLEMNARDTLNFVAQSLANLPKAVGLGDLNVAKGDFPHRANVPENWDKEIPFPDIDKYMIDKCVESKREEFAKWLAEEKERCGGVFRFRTEIVNYCSDDVIVLRLCVRKFRDDFIKLTRIDPFESGTIAAACHKYYRCVLMKAGEIAVISGHGYHANRPTSREATQWLEWENMSASDRIQHGRNGKEVKISGKYFVDGYDKQKKMVYEYNGCVFHGCPECTEEEDRAPFSNLTMREAKEAHDLKINFLERQGYEVEVKWSCEWLKERKDPDIKQFPQNQNLRDPLSARDAFKGGRTNAARLFYEVKPGEKVLHYDTVSLYPTVNKNDEYPVGHPEIIVTNFKYVRNYYGFVSCKIQPPKQPLYPVLPSTINGKLMFTLCRTCAAENHQAYCTHAASQRSLEGVWCTPELFKALDRGYVIEEINEVWHWSHQKRGLFKDYVNHFLKEKIEATGWPRWCINEEQKTQYVQQVKIREDVELDPKTIEENPGRKGIAKLMLNSFWGKWGQRDNLHQTHFINSLKKYFDLLRSGAVEIHDVFAVSSECMMVTTSPKEEYNEGNNATNVAIAAFTTSQTRLRLLDMMEKLGDRLIYYDTDSVIFVLRPGDWMPETGECLRDWSNEMKHGESHIVCFVSCGPKVYSYITDTGRVEVRAKGLTQNGYTKNMLVWDEATQALIRSGKKLDFDQLKELLMNSGSAMKVIYPEYLRKDGKTQTIMTVRLDKQIRKVYDKRVINQSDYSTIPFGTVAPP